MRESQQKRTEHKGSACRTQVLKEEAEEEKILLCTKLHIEKKNMKKPKVKCEFKYKKME